MLDGTGTISGNASIASGATIQVGNNDANGSLPSGSVTDNGVLMFSQTADVTVANVISGTGSLSKNNNNVLILSALNSFSGGAAINAGKLQVTGGGGNTGLGGGNTTVNAGGTLIGGGGDAFGYAPNTAPGTIIIDGGTVGDLGTSSYRVTMPNLTFSGGTLTNAAGNNGDGNGNYSMYGNGTTCALTTLSNNNTAVISAARISFQSPTTFNIAAGNVSGGATPGVDLLVTSAMTPFWIQPVTKIGNGVLALDANTTNSFADSITISNRAVQLGTANDVLHPLTTPMGAGFGDELYVVKYCQ